ncbi:hypothetical protein [Bacillus cereus]|nr:hypothetical protein [Bacillus cereus]
MPISTGLQLVSTTLLESLCFMNGPQLYLLY